MDLAAPLRLLGRVSPSGVRHHLPALRAAHARQLRESLGLRAVPAPPPEHGDARHHGPRRPARPVHARRLRLRALPVRRPRRRLRPCAAAAHDHAGGADRRELQHHEQARPGRHHPRHRPSLHGKRLRHLPPAPDVQDHPSRARRSRPRRGLLVDGRALACLRSASSAYVPCVRAGVGELPLEQLSLAAGGDELGEHPTANRWLGYLWGAGVGCGLVGDQCRYADRGGPATPSLPSISASVHAVLHAGRDQVRSLGGRGENSRDLRLPSPGAFHGTSYLHEGAPKGSICHKVTSKSKNRRSKTLCPALGTQLIQ